MSPLGRIFVSVSFLLARHVSGQVASCDAWVAEFYRRQQSEFNQVSPFDGDTAVKHKPFIRIIGSKAVLTVGLQSVTGDPDDPLHPMTDSDDPEILHYIDALYAVDQNDVVVSMRRLSPRESAPATFTFSIPLGVTRLTAYEHCNIHGLYKGETVYVRPEQVADNATRCDMQVCSETNMADCTSTAVEAMRQHQRLFSMSEPFTGDDNVKHKPYITVSGTTATMVVGLGAVPGNPGEPIHPMTPSADPAIVHWIIHMWAENQLGEIVAMRDLEPDEASPATLTFSIPEGTTQLTAFEHCNKHGVFKGDPVDVTTAQVAAGQQPVCEVQFCPGSFLPVPPPAKVLDCDAQVAELYRRQQFEFNRLAAFEGDTNPEHKPFIRIVGQTAVISVGLGSVTGNPNDPVHEMHATGGLDSIHYIDVIYAVDQDGVVVAMRRVSPEDDEPASFSFLIPQGVTQMTAFQHCNVHGLYRGEVVSVRPNQVSKMTSRCNMEVCSATNIADCNATVVELFRQQVRQFNQEAPFDGSTNVKHKPYLSISGTTATIVVGLGATQPNSSEPIHPMVPSTDTATIHWIDHIWATNQRGEIVAMRDFAATEPSPATLTFTIPEGTTKLTPYEHCNKHGIFEGDPVDVAPAQTEVGHQAICLARFCPGAEVPIPPPSTEYDCVAMVADLYRLQQNEFQQATPFDGDGFLKHKPYIRVVGRTAVISVGQRSVTGNESHLLHPMTDSPDPELIHFIAVLYAVDQDDVVVALRRVSPREQAPATFAFAIPEGVTRLTAYEYCNIHGLFRGQTIAIEPHQRTAGVPRRCGLEMCERTQVGDCESSEVELQRQHTRAFGQEEPFDKTDSVKHTPYLLVSGSTATIVVGLGAVPGNDGQPIHPMTASADPAAAHWIDHLWATNHAGDVVAMRDLGASEQAPASLSFTIPENTTTLTPYEHCNLHGLYKGDTVDLTVMQTKVGRDAECLARFCPDEELGPDSAPATTTDCEAVVAEIYRRQAQEFPSSGGQPLECSADAMHCPILAVNGTRATVVVGTGAVTGSSSDPIHPMDSSDIPSSLHWIDTIYVVDQTNRIVGMRKLSPLEDAPATLVFDVPAGVTRLTPYQHCNIHGVYRGAAVDVNETWSQAQAGCTIQKCTGLSSRGCTAFTLEAARLQKAVFSQNQPFDGDLDEKHKPFITIDGTTATIVVGKRGVTGNSSDPLHPMVPSMDLSRIHYITAIWALDQHLRVIAYRDILPTEPAPASLTFSIPEGVESITAFEYCNKHGLYEGERRFVSENQTVPGLSVNPCGFRGCTAQMPSLGEAAAAADESARAADELIDKTEERQQVGEICGNNTHWGYALQKKLSPNFYVFLTLNFTEQRVHFLLCGKTLGWVGFGFPRGEHAMVNSDMVWGYVAEDGSAVLEDRYANAIEAPLLDEDLGGTQDLENASGWQECADSGCTSGATFLQFSRPFITPDSWDAQLSDEDQQITVVYAIQSLNSDAMTYHGPTRGHNTLPWNLVCANGTYLFIEDFTCEPCEIGFFREDPMPMTECVRCPLGTYADEPGQARCKACPHDRSTSYPGATSIDRCFCEAGFYGDGTSPCYQCQEGLECPFGSDLENYRRAQNALEKYGPTSFSHELFGPYPRLKPMYYSSVDEPTSVFRCKNEDMCPGGEPGTCGPNLCKVACGECEDQYVLVGSKCEVCVRDDYMHVAPFLLLGPFLVLALDKLLNFPIENADGMDRVLRNMVFVLMRMAQVIAIAGTIDATNMPSSVTFVNPFSKVFLLDIQWLRLACGMAAYQKNYYVTLAGPLVFVGLFIFSYVFFMLLSKLPGVSTFFARFGVALPLKKPKLCNTYLACVNALYISLTNVATGIFQCVTHPNGMTSMLSARHVICGEERWMTLLPASVAAVCVYTGGFFVLVGFANFVAPRRFHDRAFRIRWLFLLEKFRPGAWWWNQVIISTALALNLSTIMFTTGASQAYWMIAALMLYSGALAWVRPWRHWLLNTMDMLICYSMVGVVALILFFVDRNRLADELETWFAFWISILFIIPIVVFVSFISIVMRGMIQVEDRAKQKLADSREFQEMAEHVVEVSAERWRKFILTLSEGDRATMKTCMDLLVSELMQHQPGRHLYQQRLIFSSLGTRTFSLPAKSWSLRSSDFSVRRSEELLFLHERTQELKQMHSGIKWLKVVAGQSISRKEFDQHYGDSLAADQLFKSLDAHHLGTIKKAMLFATVDYAFRCNDDAWVGLTKECFAARRSYLRHHREEFYQDDYRSEVRSPRSELRSPTLPGEDLQECETIAGEPPLEFVEKDIIDGTSMPTSPAQASTSPGPSKEPTFSTVAATLPLQEPHFVDDEEESLWQRLPRYTTPFMCTKKEDAHMPPYDDDDE